MTYSKPEIRSKDVKGRVRRVASGSMTPTLLKEEIILIESAGTVDVGDVIVFLSSDGIEVCHRVTAVRPDGNYITRGDRSVHPDPTPVAKERIVGRAVAVLRNGRFIDIPNGSDGLAVSIALYRRRRLRLFASRLHAALGRPLHRFRRPKPT